MLFLVNLLPRDLPHELVKYCLDFALVLDFTGSFPITESHLRHSHRHLMHWALELGYLSVLEWAHNHWCSWNSDTCMELAVLHGHFEILKFLCSHGCHLEDHNVLLREDILRYLNGFDKKEALGIKRNVYG